MAFGERLAELRRAHGLTQEAFAEQLNVSRQAVSKWESCRGYPEIDKILWICGRYGVTMDDLFRDELPPAERRETAEEAISPAPPPRQTLTEALGDFTANLSPLNKLAGAGSLLGVTALIGLCMVYLKGGGDMEMTALWIGAIIVAQLVIFLVVSAAALAATRPLVRKFTAGKAVPTNADRVLGAHGKVTETIDNDNAKGAVYVDGKTWTARSADGAVIPAGARVRIQGMEGVKLLVRELAEEETEMKTEKEETR